MYWIFAISRENWSQYESQSSQYCSLLPIIKAHNDEGTPFNSVAWQSVADLFKRCQSVLSSNFTGWKIRQKVEGEETLTGQPIVICQNCNTCEWHQFWLEKRVSLKWVEAEQDCYGLME